MSWIYYTIDLIKQKKNENFFVNEKKIRYNISRKPTRVEGDFSMEQWNQAYFFEMTSIIIIQIILIIFLLINIIRRKQAEKEALKAKNDLQESYQELEATHDQLIAGEQELHRQFIELQQNREELRISQERYLLIIEGSYDGIWDWDCNKKTIFFSNRGQEMLGFNPKERLFTYEEIVNKIYPEDQPRMKEALKRHLEEKTLYFELEQRMEIQEGKYQWFNIRGKAILNKKGRPQRLAGSITNIHEHKEADALIEKMAYYDILTGLPNRTFFSIQLKKELEAREEKGDILSLFFIDVDNFKSINDILGHRFGDVVLQQIGQVLQTFTKKDHCFRLGGDEFVLILPHFQSEDEIHQLAKDILDVFIEPLCLKQRDLFMSVSIGIAVSPYDGTNAETLLKNADIAMYHAKQTGKNTYKRYDEQLHQQIMENIKMENDLRKAIEQEEFELYYQPQMDVQLGKGCSVEALIRWNHPTQGLVSPGEFIGLAEETGLIIPIGRWVFQQACKQMKQWKQKSLGIQYIAINLSPIQFQDPQLITMIEETLQHYQIQPSDIELEITETIAMKNINYTMKVLQKLEGMGFHISLDDFGTGYSSMNYLSKLPITTVKIDRSFMIANIKEDERQQSIVRAVITLAHANDLLVVAEGVETKEQLDFLQKESCDKVQGYFYSPPLPLQKIENFIKKYPFTN